MLEPFGMVEGDKQVDGEDYASDRFYPILGARQVLLGVRSRQILHSD